MKTLLIVVLIVLQLPLFGQLIDNTASYRNINSDRYIRFHYENDYFSETDKYYTQGMNLEFFHPVISKSPLAKLVFGSSKSEVKKGIALEHLGFTPTSITEPEIIQNERPFAATLFLKTFSIISDSVKNYRLVSVLSTGVIGPAAGGNEIQQEIHRWLGNVQPVGWKYQIRNDIVLNYQVDVEKQIFAYTPLFALNAKAGGMIGTLYDKAYTGVVLMAGLFDNPYSSLKKSKRKFQVYLYAEPMINVIGYDATLQGGIFNRKSPHVIPSNNIERILVQTNFGFVLKIKRLNLEYFQSFTTAKYADQGTHRWGGIRIGYSFIK